MRKNRELLQKLDALVESGLNDFDEKRPGDGKLKKRTANLAHSLAADVRKHASPKLGRAIDAHRPDIDDFVGKPVAKVFDESTELAGEIAKAKRPKRKRR